MSENNFRSQFLPFQIDTQLIFFLKFLDKMAASGHFGLDDNVSYRTRPRYFLMNNACVKFEERSLNPSKVIALTTKLCGGRRRCGGGCVAVENIISPKTYVSQEYNYVCHHIGYLNNQ